MKLALIELIVVLALVYVVMGHLLFTLIAGGIFVAGYITGNVVGQLKAKATSLIGD